MTKMYYVTAIDGKRYVPVSGPYGSHKEALKNVDRVMKICTEVDPKSWFYKWGTSKMEWQGPGVVDNWIRDGKAVDQQGE